MTKWITVDEANHLFQPIQTAPIKGVTECSQQVHLNWDIPVEMISEALSLCFTLPYPQVLQALGL